MKSKYLQDLDVSWGDESIEIPLNRPAGTFSPTGEEGWDEGYGSWKEGILKSGIGHLKFQDLRCPMPDFRFLG